MSMEARYPVLFITALFLLGITESKPEPPNTEFPQGGAELYGVPHGGDTRIIGGKRAGYGAFPYQVSLQEKNYHICGGSLLDDRHVLTAAHCVTTEKGAVKKVKNLKIGVGSILLTGLTRYQVTHIWVHHQYKVISGMPNHDIAIIRVKCCVKFSQTVQPVYLWNDGPVEPSRTMCNVSGWGAEENDGAGTSYLNYVTVPVRPEAVCRTSYQRLPTYPICAGEANRDSCQGDSGGPLVCNSKQAGIVSFGIKCGLQKYPGVYTDVSAYLRWIEEIKARNNATHISSTLNFTCLLSVFIVLWRHVKLHSW